MKKLSLVLLVLFVGMTVVIAQETESKSIAEIASEDERFQTLVAALDAAGLVETLQSEGPFTVFAPTDEAFSKLPEGTVDELLNDIPRLTDILLYHVVPGKLMAEDVMQLGSGNQETASGKALSISAGSDGVQVNDANVIITDIEASNGVIHAVDTVLLPPEE